MERYLSRKFRYLLLIFHIFCNRLLPSDEGEAVVPMTRPTFCSQLSDDEQCFISACQGKILAMRKLKKI